MRKWENVRGREEACGREKEGEWKSGRVLGIGRKVEDHFDGRKMVEVNRGRAKAKGVGSKFEGRHPRPANNSTNSGQ